MSGIEKILKEAREMIGMRTRHAEVSCTIIDVMEDRLEIILEADTSIHAIQADAYGNARREIRTLYSIPIFNQVGGGLHPDFTHLSERRIAAPE